MSTILPWLIWDRQGDLLLNGHSSIPKTSKRGACFCWPKGFRARILDARFGDLI